MTARLRPAFHPLDGPTPQAGRRTLLSPGACATRMAPLEGDLAIPLDISKHKRMHSPSDLPTPLPEVQAKTYLQRC